MTVGALDRYLAYLGRRPIARLVTVQLGIWEVIYKEEYKSLLPDVPSNDGLMDAIGLLPSVYSFLKEIYSIAPRQMTLYVLGIGLKSLKSGLKLYISGCFLDAIMSRLQGSERATTGIYRAIAQQIMISVVSGMLRNLLKRERAILHDRVVFHYNSKALHEVLYILDNDVSTNCRPRHRRRRYSPFNPLQEGAEAMERFTSLKGLVSTLAQGVSQIYFGFSLVKSFPFDPIFVFFSVAETLIRLMGGVSMRDIDYVGYCANNAYMRLLSLNELAFDDSFRADVQSDGVGDYIEREYNLCRKQVGDNCTESIALQWYRYAPVVNQVLKKLLKRLPMLYFAYRAIRFPGSMSVNSFTVLQQASYEISWTFHYMALEIPDAFEIFRDIRDAQTESASRRRMKDGQITYPAGSSVQSDMGMQIEFRNVSFAYPDTTKNAISNVSFTIQPGQIVAIVGVNGSGKSTITNLFNRLYDPTEGEILIDGLPLPSYQVADVRKHMSILRQNHPIYPLSLRENIALGLPDAEPGDEQLEAAIRDGGAYGFVQKLPRKLDTVLNPMKVTEGNLTAEDVPELKDVFDGEVETGVSGGEAQRLAASRTFMRLQGGRIRFLAADEPTSALDPEGERDLFARLRQRRKGMTVVFITHRFGHITRYADLILCMKDGELVEQGTHKELIDKDGEYCKLHTIQAQAFAEEVEDQIASTGS